MERNFHIKTSSTFFFISSLNHSLRNLHEEEQEEDLKDIENKNENKNLCPWKMWKKKSFLIQKRIPSQIWNIFAFRIEEVNTNPASWT